MTGVTAVRPAGAHPAWRARWRPCPRASWPRREPFPARAVIPAAGGVEPLAKRFGACAGRGGADSRVTAPSGQPQSPAHRGYGRPGHDCHLERSARPARAAPCPARQCHAPAGADQL